MKLLSLSQYAKISFSGIKLPDMISRKLFNSRLGSACSRLAALLFKLQECSMMDLNKMDVQANCVHGKSLELMQIQGLFQP